LRRIGLVCFVMAMFFVFAGCAPKADTAEIERINTQELEQRLSQAPEDTIFIDVREPEEYASGHIEGMINMPLSSFSETYSQLPKDKEIVIICRSGNRSMQAAQLLREKGYTRIVNVDGGMLDWKGPVVTAES